MELTKVLLWIYLWGENIVQEVLDIVFWNENFENVSFNWGKLILFNNMIINASFEYLIGLFIYNKEPLGCKECNEMSHFLST
jgi:hypothetical protein